MSNTVASNQPTPIEELGKSLKSSYDELFKIGRELGIPNLKHFVQLNRYLVTIKTPQVISFDFSAEKAICAELKEEEIVLETVDGQRITYLFDKIKKVLNTKRESFFTKEIQKTKEGQFQSEIFKLIVSLTDLFTDEKKVLLGFHQKKETLFETFNEATRHLVETATRSTRDLQVGCLS